MDPLTAGILTGAGAVGAGVSGYANASQQNKNINAGIGTIEDIMGRVPGQVSQVTGDLQQAYSPYTQNAQSDMDTYRQNLGQVGSMQYNQADPFAYNLQSGTQQFLDPLMDAKIKSATQDLQSSAANRGGLFSSATGRATANQAAEMKGAGWKEAMEMALKDRGFQYGVYGDDIARDRANTDLALKQQQLKLQGLGDLTGMGQTATTNLATGVADAQIGGYKALNEADLQKANLEMQRQATGFMPFVGDMLSGGAGTMGAIMGGK